MMSEHYPRQFVRIILLLAVIFGAATVTYSQPNGLDRMTDRQANEVERVTSKKTRDPKEVLNEVNEDLRRLNELNEGISLTVKDQPVNYPSVVEILSEIKKRATRLKSSLALPAEENEKKSAGYKDAEKTELQPTLAELNKLLNSFLRNPIFSDTGPLDLRLAAQAKRDLEDVIVLSEKLRKNAEKRSKATAKSP